jgi:tetratricopeptide (TPR) repeat protein
LGAGRLAEALQTAQSSLAVAERAYGGSHPAVAESLNELAQLKTELAMFDGVDEMFSRAIAIQSAVTGPESPEVAASVNNLALAYEKRGHDVEAERLYRRAVAIYEASVGERAHERAHEKRVAVGLLDDDLGERRDLRVASSERLAEQGLDAH